jgi:hypothetical protein
MKPAKGVNFFIRAAESGCLMPQFHSSQVLCGVVFGQFMHSKGFCTKAVHKQRRRGGRVRFPGGLKTRAG